VDSQQSLNYRKGALFFEDVDLEELARGIGTPCYVYSRRRILTSVKQLQAAFERLSPRICYAVKANSNLSILRLFAREGLSFDIVSEGELYRLRKIGVPADRILFSGVGKTPGELEAAVRESIFSVTAESPAELADLGGISRVHGRPIQVGLRIIPDVRAGGHSHISTGLYEHKFGIDPDELGNCVGILKAHPLLQLTGIGCHIGSQVESSEPYFTAFTRIRGLADKLRSRGFRIRCLNLGGGFGVSYDGGSGFDLKVLADFLTSRLGKYHLILEPGRCLIASAGLLLCRVLYLKRTRERRFIIVDAAMNDFQRPVLYGAHHRIIPVQERPGKGLIRADIAGPVCETSDVMGLDRRITEPDPGDILAVLDTGAYGFVAASNYNSRRRPPEVLVEGNRFRIIRRRETLEDLLLDEVQRIGLENSEQ